MDANIDVNAYLRAAEELAAAPQPHFAAGRSLALVPVAAPAFQSVQPDAGAGRRDLAAAPPLVVRFRRLA